MCGMDREADEVWQLKQIVPFRAATCWKEADG